MKLIMTGRLAGAVLAMLAGVAVAYFGLPHPVGCTCSAHRPGRRSRPAGPFLDYRKALEPGVVHEACGIGDGLVGRRRGVYYSLHTSQFTEAPRQRELTLPCALTREDNAAGGGKATAAPSISHVGGVTTPGETGIAGLGIAATATTRI